MYTIVYRGLADFRSHGLAVSLHTYDKTVVIIIFSILQVVMKHAGYLTSCEVITKKYQLERVTLTDNFHTEIV